MLRTNLFSLIFYLIATVQSIDNSIIKVENLIFGLTDLVQLVNWQTHLLTKFTYALLEISSKGICQVCKTFPCNISKRILIPLVILATVYLLSDAIGFH